MLTRRTLPILLFMLLLLLPLTAYFTGFPEVEPLQEYRALAERPALSTYFNAEKNDFPGYTEQLNRWFLDQFPTRPFWVRLHTQLLYSVFGESDQLHVGKDGWLFYRNVLDNEEVVLRSTAPLFKVGLVTKFARLSMLLEQRGIVLYVMPAALKSRYYPEFLPASAEHARDFRFFDDLMDLLVRDGRMNIIDTRPILEGAKQQGMKIFHQTDFHWTDPAGALVFRQLLNELGEQEGKPALASSWDYEIAELPDYSGGQARALPLFRMPTETTVEVKVKGPLTEFVLTKNRHGIETAGVATATSQQLMEPVFLYGDSFADAAIRSGFFNFFRAYASSRLFVNDLTEAYRNRQPGTRYMVLEFITSGTFGMDNNMTTLIAALEADPAL